MIFIIDSQIFCHFRITAGMTVTHASPQIKRPLVILNLFQDNEQPSHVILKQVQDDEKV
jgi:hypothetical protein